MQGLNQESLTFKANPAENPSGRWQPANYEDEKQIKKFLTDKNIFYSH